MANRPPTTLISFQDTKKRIPISDAHFYRLIKTGALGKVVKIGRRSFLIESNLEKYFENLPTGVSPGRFGQGMVAREETKSEVAPPE